MDNQAKKPSGKRLGGKREGAGRKPGSGLYKEPTTVMRVPSSQKAVIGDFLKAYAKKQAKKSQDGIKEFALPVLTTQTLSIPLFNSKVAAGLPSPADDHVEKRMDPNSFLIDAVDSTFFVTIQGESMLDAGLLPDDKAVVDRAKTPVVGDIILAMVDGEFTIKTLGKQKNGDPRLIPANASGAYRPINIQGDMQFEIWGVVTGSFRRFK